MEKLIVSVTDNRFSSYGEEEAVLKPAGAVLKIYDYTKDDEFAGEILSSQGLLVNLCPLREPAIRRFSQCRVISRYGVGYDNVDIEAAARRGIWVANVPDYCVEDTSDHTIALLLSAIRRIPYTDMRVKSGAWNIHKEVRLFRIKGRILGLIGFGRIARTVARKIGFFGLSEILVYDPYVEPGIISNGGCIPVTLEELLSRSDYISIHVPLTEETRGLIGTDEFPVMKQGAILVNTSRGRVIDQDALTEALLSGKLGGAGLDVFREEPIPPDSPLLTLDNAVLSSHMAYYSEESLVELKRKAAENVAAVLRGGRPLYPVNEPDTVFRKR
ncbi:MAG: C-terminal binding protein [Spirochaetales bacterium]|nr:C-terminal binding protein [Spirochaetales bacterium]